MVLEFNLNVKFDEKDLRKFGKNVNKAMAADEPKAVLRMILADVLGKMAEETPAAVPNPVVEPAATVTTTAAAPKKRVRKKKGPADKEGKISAEPAAPKPTDTAPEAPVQVTTAPAPEGRAAPASSQEPAPAAPKIKTMKCTKCGADIPITLTSKGKPRKELSCPACGARYKLKPKAEAPKLPVPDTTPIQTLLSGQGPQQAVTAAV